MLSRGLSNASSRSSQPKSLNFVQTYPPAPQEHNRRDSEISHQQAIAAASFAYERASERVLAARNLQGTDIAQAVNTEEQIKAGGRLGRKQSIRFTGLTAVPIRNRSITRRVAPDYDRIQSLPTDGQSISPAMGGYVSDHRVSGARNPSLGKGDAYGSRFFSRPGSQRRLPRARSMFSLRVSAPNIFSDNGLHKNSKVQQKLAGSKNEHGKLLGVTDSRLRRSFSFLQGEKDHMASGLDLQTNKVAVAQLAREQYHREQEEQKLKVDSTSAAAGQQRKYQRAFRRSVRSSSTNSYGCAITSTPGSTGVSAPKKSLGFKARSLSLSLKEKLKRVFHRPSDLETSIPIQHLDASRPHFGEYASNVAGIDQEYHHIPSPDIETLRKAKSRESSLDRPPGFPETESPAKSIRSVRTEDEHNPLFTSLANATPGNIPTSTEPREKKRLSVIQEHGGPHQPFSDDHNCAGLSDVFHTPMRGNGTGKEIGAFVDSQKVYSALQQKMHESRCLTQHGDHLWEDGKDANEVEVNNFRASRAFLTSQPQLNTSVDGLLSDHGIQNANVVSVESARTGSMFNGKPPAEDQSNDYSIQEELLDLYTTQTPQQMAEPNENYDTSPKRPLQETKGAFFPSSMRIQRASPSPYRRLMGSGSENEISDFEGNKPFRVRSESAFGGSASIYSRTSSGSTPKENKSSVSLTKSETSQEHGQALTITALPLAHGELLTNPARQSKSSKESERQLNRIEPEMIPLDTRGLANIYDHEKAGKNICHKRENAQIDDDDFETKRLDEEAHKKRQALGNLRERAIIQPNLRNQTSRSVFTRPPLLEIGQSTAREESEYSSTPSPSGPSTPRRSSYLTHEIPFGQRNQRLTVSGRTSSHGTPKSQGSDFLRNGDDYMLKHGISVSTEKLRMDATQDIYGTPTPAPIRAIFRTNRAAKSQGYNSPERIARIRRLQSSNSLAAHTKYEVERSSGEPEIEQDSQGSIKSKNLPTTGNISNKNISGTAFENTQSTAVRRMVDVFLSNRGRNTAESQDSTVGVAFL